MKKIILGLFLIVVVSIVFSVIAICIDLPNLTILQQVSIDLNAGIRLIIIYFFFIKERPGGKNEF